MRLAGGIVLAKTCWRLVSVLLAVPLLLVGPVPAGTAEGRPAASADWSNGAGTAVVAGIEYVPALFVAPEYAGMWISTIPILQPGPHAGEVAVGYAVADPAHQYHAVVQVVESAFSPPGSTLQPTPAIEKLGVDWAVAAVHELLQALQEDLERRIGPQETVACPRVDCATVATVIHGALHGSSVPEPARDATPTPTPSTPGAPHAATPLAAASRTSATKPFQAGGPERERSGTPEGAFHNEVAAIAASVSVVLFPLTVFTLFSRIRPVVVLDHPHRRRILELATQYPGIRCQDIAATLGLHATTIRYHVKVLKSHDLVTTGGSGSLVGLFPVGACSLDERNVLPLLRSTVARSILRLVAQRPGIRQAELARCIGRSDATIAFHLARLEAAHAVRIELCPRGVGKRVHPTMPVTDALISTTEIANPLQNTRTTP